MKKIAIAIVIAFVLLAFLGVLGSTEIGNAVLSNSPASAKFTACKSPLKNIELLNREREKNGLEPIKQK